jgi:hypothetical protein
MSKMPRYDPWRPDFEAPGPHVKIEKKGGVVFEAPANRDPDSPGDDDDDFTSYRYYESDKILGKLYRAIDERKVFNEIKQRSASVTGATNTATIIHAVWAYVKHETRLIHWEHKRDWARDLRDQYEECLINIMADYSEHPLRPLSERKYLRRKYSQLSPRKLSC